MSLLLFSTITQRLFIDTAKLVIADIADYSHMLYPAEENLLRGMQKQRAHEFSTGRFCAHQALHQLGINNFPILKGEQREPIWPAQIVGSISHCRDLAGAVIADKRHMRSIGFDIEIRKQLNPAIARHVCTENERTWLNAQNPIDQNLLLLIIFSLKEAVFKCVYQAMHTHLRFSQCEIMPLMATGETDIKLLTPDVSLSAEELRARFYVSDSHVFSSVLWRYLPAVG